MTNERRHLLKAVRLAGAMLALLLVAAFAPAPAAAQVRIKDIASFEGVRDNLLVGYGLVVGLNGTGDNLSNSPFTQQSIIGMLERLGINIRGENFKPKNVAAVMVTATLPPFSREGSRLATWGPSDLIVWTLEEKKALVTREGVIHAAAFAPDGSSIAFISSATEAKGPSSTTAPTMRCFVP